MTIYSAGYSTLDEAWGNPASLPPRGPRSRQTRAAAAFDRDSSSETRRSRAALPPAPQQHEDFQLPQPQLLPPPPPPPPPSPPVIVPAPAVVAAASMPHYHVPEVLDLMLYMISGITLIYIMEQVCQVGIMLGRAARLR